MVEQFHSSFIPKKPNEDSAIPGRKASVGWFMALAVILVIVSVAGAIGVFSYTKIIEGSIARKEASLNEARDIFEPGLIRELTRLDSRLKISEEIISSHVSPSGIFDALEELTLENVQFGNFSYVVEPEGYILNMSGQAKSFGTVAIQSDVFGASDDIRNPIFSGLNINSDGRVVFTFEGTVAPEVLKYEARPRVELPTDTEGGGDDDTTLPGDDATSSDDDASADDDGLGDDLGDDGLGDIDDLLGDLDGDDLGDI